jgi:serine/threonine protein kinase
MVGVAISKALEVVHQADRIHRDIKPSNIHVNCDPDTINTVSFFYILLFSIFLQCVLF